MAWMYLDLVLDESVLCLYEQLLPLTKIAVKFFFVYLGS